MTRTLKPILAILVLLFGVATVAVADNTLEVVTNIGGGGPQGQPEDADCVQEGSYGMRITMDGSSNETYVQAGPASGFSDETVIRASFWINADDNGGNHGIRDFSLAGFGPASSRPFRVMQIHAPNVNKEQVRMICQVNCAGGPGTFCPFIGTGTLDLADGWNQVLAEWTQGSAAPAPADSICRLSLIGGGNAGATTEQIRRMAQYNVQRVRLGRTGGGNFSPTATGNKCFDDAQFFRTLAP